MGQHFTYITGVLAVIAFILQVRDVFPQHREVRKAALLIAFGVFLGSIIGSINKVQFKVEADFHPVQLILVVFLAITALGAVFFTIAGALTSASEKRDDLYGITGGAVVLFFVVLIAIGISFGFSEKKESIDQFRDQEIVALIDHNTKIGDYERALAYLEKLKSRFGYGDPRYERAGQQIQKLKEMIANSLLREKFLHSPNSDME